MARLFSLLWMLSSLRLTSWRVGIAWLVVSGLGLWRFWDLELGSKAFRAEMGWSGY